MRRLLETIKKEALPAIWSQGVKLVRENSVTSVTRASANDSGEVTVRVRAPGHPIAPTVILYVEDNEWSCDCGSKVDPCAHVAAAAITCAKGENGSDIPQAPAKTARLVYRLGTKRRLLTLTRVVIHDDGREEPFGGTLASELGRGRGPTEFSPTHEDLLIDRILGSPARDVVPLARVGDIFEALSHDAVVTFDGTPVRVSGEGLAPRAVVEDAPGGGFVVRIEKNPAMAELVAMGVARCRTPRAEGAPAAPDTFRPLTETTTTGDFLERLPLARTFPRAHETELVTRVIPELEKGFSVVIKTNKLPRKAAHLSPRIAMDLSHQGHTLSILPTLVYGDPPIARVDGDTVTLFGKDVPVRRRDEERELILRLRDDLNLVPGRRVDLDGTEAIRFAAKLRDWQQRTGDEAHAKVFENHALSARLDLQNGLFDVIFEVDPATDGPALDKDGNARGSRPPSAATGRRADAEAVIRAWRDGLDLVPLQGGGWAPLPAQWLNEHGHLVADLLAARDPEKKLPTAALPELGALCDALDTPKPLGVGKLLPLVEGFAGIPHADLPKGIFADLRAYQRVGVDWLSFLRDAELGAVLADDMGLGKTLQTICAVSGRTLVVCPKSVVYNWADEIQRFRPGLRTHIYQGVKRELDRSADVTLVTYAVLRLDATVLSSESWDTVILDEAQAIKNPTSQTARAAFELKGAFRVALSGTPVENRLEELWSLMHFANPGLLGGRSDFQERYASPISVGDPSAASRLRAKIRPFVLRRMKREVLPELPPRTDAILHVELDDVERSVYDAVRVATKKDVALALSQGGNVLAALEALLRLRQAACHAQLVPGQKAESSSKVDRLLEALEETTSEGHKALVFSQWTSFLDLLEPHLGRAGIKYTRLDGATRDRGAVVSEFQAEDGPPVMLVSLKAGGTGLNLTAADHVFLLDPWWNPAVEDQAADRAHRIGQDRPVMVYRMVTKDTVEERILALKERKRALADVALGNADHAGGITRDELLALLE
ncbi:SNF2-related protein [Pendulispora albinea]|uniref:DEAD/DEAH box helicase n=1 Tax=Pendulispora albinea TaxID=2741071 RepID=A0ABZ2LP74_9BACT